MPTGTSSRHGDVRVSELAKCFEPPLPLGSESEDESGITLDQRAAEINDDNDKIIGSKAVKRTKSEAAAAVAPPMTTVTCTPEAKKSRSAAETSPPADSANIRSDEMTAAPAAGPMAPPTRTTTTEFNAARCAAKHVLQAAQGGKPTQKRDIGAIELQSLRSSVDELRIETKEWRTEHHALRAALDSVKLTVDDLREENKERRTECDALRSKINAFATAEQERFVAEQERLSQMPSPLPSPRRSRPHASPMRNLWGAAKGAIRGGQKPRTLGDHHMMD